MSEGVCACGRVCESNINNSDLNEKGKVYYIIYMLFFSWHHMIFLHAIHTREE